MRKLLTLKDIDKGDILDPIPNFIYKKPLKIFRKDENYFYIRVLNKEVGYHKRVLKYFFKRKLKRTLRSNDFE